MFNVGSTRCWGDGGLRNAAEDLSAATRSAWAKSDPDSGQSLSLIRHLADSAAIAEHLWDQWLPDHVKSLIAEGLPEGLVDGRTLAVWLAGTHDIGKLTPAFACQCEPLAQAMRECGLDMPTRTQFGDDRRVAPHGLAGQVLLREWLMERHGWSGRSADAFTVIAGGHHGVPPSYSQLHDLDAYPELLRTPGASEGIWKSSQHELLDACAVMTGASSRLAHWRGLRLSQQAQVLLTGLVIVADWIASNTDLFPYPALGTGEAAIDPGKRVELAWRGLELPAPWAPKYLMPGMQGLLASRFGLPADAQLRPVQQMAVQLASANAAPGLLVIEAPMGEGKTEAALLAAEILAARSGAGGVFLALPTQATSNAMFARVVNWLRQVPREGVASVHLAHGKAALDDAFASFLRAAPRLTSIDADGYAGEANVRRDRRAGSADMVAHQWLRGRKKGILSPFVVGTIDQLLFTGLKSRHLALRHLAVAGKVVVIDEVHAYDAYMSVYLERVLSWLGAYRVPVVLLSATLPADRRQALVEAYGGITSEALRDAREAYPVLTAVTIGAPAQAVGTEPAEGRRVDVNVEAFDDDLGRLADRLEAELVDGGCALIIRNTVGRVLQTAQQLRERFGAGQVTVAHSRFIDLDRARKDADLLARFGHDGARPRRHIVVASQVAEQSLDIDFDLLVTDLAPIDLVLQRMGRVHRHHRGGPEQSERPPSLRTARCLVTGVDWAGIPSAPIAGSVAVYGLHPLLRSLAVLQPYLTGSALTLPGDINPLVQCAYAQSFVAPTGWGEAMDAAQAEHMAHIVQQREGAMAFCLDEVRGPGRSLIGWIDGGVGDADDTRAGRAQVRDSPETIEVLVVQRGSDGVLRTLPWLDRGRGGLELPTEAVPPPRAARAAAASALRLPGLFAKPWMFDRVLRELEREYHEAWQAKESSWLQGELLLVLDEECRTVLAGYELSYNPDDGLEMVMPGEPHAAVVRDKEASDDKTASFDLTSAPWLPVLYADGMQGVLSLRDVFAQSNLIRRLVGDLPTQDFALLRLLLAVLYDAVDGPRDGQDWEDLWTSDDPFAAVPAYLDSHRERFDLLHPATPFYQVPGLQTAKGEVGPLNKIVADVPDGDPFLTMRMPGVEQLSFAEAARWLVHTQAFDTSGIKSGVVGDPKAVNGKRYPQGVAWLGNLGGVFAEGDTLRQTLLLNLIPADTTNLQVTSAQDVPAWRGTNGRAGSDHADAEPRVPAGLRDLYTWQSRRIRLEYDTRGVTGAVLTYGDELTAHNKHGVEPMTGWRRSKPQEKKLGLSTVYMPQQHDPTRAAWRGIESLLAGSAGSGSSQTGEPASHYRPKIVDWLGELAHHGNLPSRGLIRVRTSGAVYGTQQSIIDEVVSDELTMAVVLLHEDDPRFGKAAVTAVKDADSAVAALGDLASDLARAAGLDPEPERVTARDRAFGALDGPYRRWLLDLGNSTDPAAMRAVWQGRVYDIIAVQGQMLLDSAGSAAAQGRMVKTTRGERWMDDSLADLYFKGRIAKALSSRLGKKPTDPGEPVGIQEDPA
ncbi:CRISPR-associated protein, Cse1 family [Catenulispora acidiphila DSM 44928]|uniref:CRISPR-associated protein, Cse1 family n=1 Tax=Catenulispora acidiphila (strain DSM 44928 / JCM 14897 / NBRC 102108 / NRRL B-24433 / ID139908) TaxID=479433 RepID=C7QEM7_CATAD|nr:CRISPR-associated protein, Cse1 family [Catenulispora acidiphila DSM 44928]